MSLPLLTHAHAHITEDFNLDPDEYDPMDDMEISAADKSVRIRSRLKKLMAKRPQLDTLKKSGTYIDPVFGCELAKLYEREKCNVPHFLTQFMEHIEQHGLQVVGIYRLSGNAASVQKLRFLVEQGMWNLVGTTTCGTGWAPSLPSCSVFVPSAHLFGSIGGHFSIEFGTTSCAHPHIGYAVLQNHQAA